MDVTVGHSFVKAYFVQGFKDSEISALLHSEHSIILSTRQIRRIRKAQGLSKRDYCEPRQLVEFVLSQLNGSGRLHGYRIMYAKCREQGLKVRMEDVRLLLRQLDPDGVDIRMRRRLRRRAYYAPGPNFIWHIDGYDKLKPFGLAIHGCVDGYSREIIWLNAYRTNNNPKVVGSYFMEAVERLGGCPMMVRGDLGTENGHIRDFQLFLRRYANAESHRCYIEGASTANQRIEAWWGFLRKECAHFWIENLRELSDDGDFCGDTLDKSLVQFCFMGILQNELDATAGTWNGHTIRPSSNDTVPCGRPHQMYRFPSLWGAEDKACNVNDGDVEICKEECEFRSAVPCDMDVFNGCTSIMARDRLEPAANWSDARELYLHLRSELR